MSHGDLTLLLVICFAVLVACEMVIWWEPEHTEEVRTWVRRQRQRAVWAWMMRKAKR